MRAAEQSGADGNPTLPPTPRRGGADEGGQVLVLAAIGMLALVLMVMTTVNLGEAVHERIKLQNTADSAAYTLAAMEARTFNYIAFLNRTQLAHYNTAMVIQSYTTWVGFHISAVGGAVDLVRSLHAAFAACTMASCPACSSSCVGCCVCCAACGKALAFTEGIRIPAIQLLSLATAAYQVGGLIGHLIVEAVQIFNEKVIWEAQAWRAVLMNPNLLTGMQNYIEKNDPSLALYRGGRNLLNMLVNAGLNSYEYWSAFDSGAGANPQAIAFMLDLPKVLRGSVARQKEVQGAKEQEEKGEKPEIGAYRVMTELAHATRSPRFVWDRATGLSLGGLFGISLTGGKVGSTGFTPTDDGIEGGAVCGLIDGPKHNTAGVYLSSHDFAGSAAGCSAGSSYSLTGAIKFLEAVGGPPAGKTLGDAIAGYGASQLLDDESGSDAGDDSVARGQKSAKLGKHYGYDAGMIAKVLGDDLGLKLDLGLGGLLGELKSTFEDAMQPLTESLQGLNELGQQLMSPVTEALDLAGAEASAIGQKGIEEAKRLGLDPEKLKAQAEGRLAALRGKSEAELKGTPEGLLAGSADATDPTFFDKLAPYVPYLQLIYAAMQDPAMLAKILGGMALNWAMNLVQKMVAELVNKLIADLMKQVWDALLAGSGVPCLGFFVSLITGSGHQGKAFKTHDHVPWPGFAPYFKFNASDDPTIDFGQPSTWIFLSKPAEYLDQRQGDKWPAYAHFVWEHGQYRAEIDTTSGWSNATFMFDGPWVVSRGMAYYHRPGYWTEQPNFFNPFWRARLAPIGQKLMNYWEGFAGRRLGGGAESMVVSQVLNVIRNAQMDVFTGLVTALVTH